MTQPLENHGPLPTMLGMLTLLAGIVDAVTFLKYGHVFVANMTGNVIFIAFGLAGDAGISVLGSVAALAAFLVGALSGGLLNQRLGAHRGKLLAASTSIKAVLLVAATSAAALGAPPLTIIPLLGITMGIQNAVARKLAIVDITTTVLTMTITGLMADSSLAGGTNPRLARRISAVATMFFGALLGAVTVFRLGIPYALGMASIIVLATSVAAYLLGRGDPEWTKAAA